MSGFVPAAAGVFALLAFRAAAAPPLIIETARPAAERAAAAWRPQGASPPARGAAGLGEGIVFHCPFDRGAEDRFFWDREARLDLSAYTSIEVDLTCDRPEALRSLAVYLESGNGWYVWNRPLPRAGRQLLTLRRHESATEGTPAGWRRITRIRLSPWKGAPVAATIRIHGIRARSDPVLVIRGAASMPPAERAAAARAADRVCRWLAAAGAPFARLDEEAVNDATLRDVRAAILPYNTRLPDATLAALRDFVARGGKLIVFYSADPRLAEIVGVRLGSWKRADQPLQWCSFRFSDAAAWNAPETVFQTSGGLLPVFPAASDVAVIAVWQDDRGRPTGDPAWVAGPRGAWMSHILLPGDSANKQHLLAGLLLRYAPEVGPDLADAALREAGRIDSFGDMDEAVRAIRAAAAFTLEGARVEELLAEAVRRRAGMGRARAEGRSADVLAGGRRLRQALTEAYALSQSPAPGEVRAVWDHNGLGWYPGDWERTARELRAAGINTLFVNMLWAGLAHYPSAVVPESASRRQYGDLLAQCIAAARRHGIRVHLWYVCWNAENAPADWRERMARDGRLQTDIGGRPVAWLNPADSRNVELALQAIREAATRYSVDGVHLDYVRWPSADSDFGAASRRAFERATGRRAARWPDDVRGNGPLAAAWREWRASVISDFVRRARDTLRAARPDAQLSAAVWGNYPECAASIGQDWGLWLRSGWLDFAAPMNYTENVNAFTALTRRQMALAGARGRLIPGIGVSAGESSLAPDMVIEQIVAARRQGAGGFSLFQLDAELRDRILPMLRLGITRP